MIQILNDGEGANSFRTKLNSNFEEFENYVPYSGATGDLGLGENAVVAKTAKFTDLTDGYLPYHINDTNGLGNSPIYTDGTSIGVNTTSPSSKVGIATSISFAYVEKTNTYIIGEDDFTINCTANSFTVILPTAVGIAGRIYNIKNTGSGTIMLNAATVEEVQELVDGEHSHIINQWENITVQSTGTGWIIL